MIYLGFRRFYFANDGEKLQHIGKKLGVDSRYLLQLNKGRLGGALKLFSSLMAGTRIDLVPTAENTLANFQANSNKKKSKRKPRKVLGSSHSSLGKNTQKISLKLGQFELSKSRDSELLGLAFDSAQKVADWFNLTENRVLAPSFMSHEVAAVTANMIETEANTPRAFRSYFVRKAVGALHKKRKNVKRKRAKTETMSRSMHNREQHEADTHATKDCKVDVLDTSFDGATAATTIAATRPGLHPHPQIQPANHTSLGTRHGPSQGGDPTRSIRGTQSISRTPGEDCEFCVARAAKVDALTEQLRVASTSVAAPNINAALAKELASVKATLEARNMQLRAKDTELLAKDAELQAKKSEIGRQNNNIKQAAVDLESKNNLHRTLTSDNAKLKCQLFKLNVSTNTARAAAAAMAATLDETKQIAQGLRERLVAANKSKLAAEKKLGYVEVELAIIKEEHVGTVQLRQEVETLRRQLKDEVCRSSNAARESVQTLVVEQRLKAVGVTQCDLTHSRCASTLLVAELEQLRARFAQAEEEYDVQSRQLRSARAKLGLPTTYY
jgi:hypothetical protein